MGSISPWHLLLVFLVVVVVFGSKRLPDTARALGKSMRILKSETAAMKNDGGKTGSETSAPGDGGTAPRTIQAAPGDTESSRPVEEPKRTSQG
ncbi:Sec-independent protein translocase subunit TatA [Streptomyces litchfieldiae]|uniref:Sec-independent protein translocase protein TatA n=1 Tax=Streptomyces litchfieldiae TaxID=3075543 RepID=A0ABU2MVK0_9ACTN|nr:Sec-independent protein translocase subunit TatA [Streptomyces sp. DSM 44938]MDT0345663.1 Sec-independent protein translocase subunit TatA [Streptomyces sp. DSM 44938]